MTELASALSSVREIKLQIACACAVHCTRVFEMDGVVYYLFPEPNSKGSRDIETSLAHANAIIRETRPDVLHIHGTERFYGLLTAREIARLPTVISVQGLLGACSSWTAFFGTADPVEIIRMHRGLEILSGRGLLWNYIGLRRAARLESEILRGNRFFLGRTEWDRAYISLQNPGARYRIVGELLRPEFWAKRWKIETASRYRIVFAGGGHPRKGIDTLLDAVELLVPRYREIELHIAGNISRRSGYGRHVRHRISKFGGRVSLLGHLDAAGLAEAFCSARVFVLPSFIENSSNSLCEAMLVGMPCVASFAGGIPSLIEDGESGLLTTPGDAYGFASKIAHLLDNDSDARSLGERAAEIARVRHDPGRVLAQLLDAYAEACGNNAT